jgi:hypothetical protein
MFESQLQPSLLEVAIHYCFEYQYLRNEDRSPFLRSNYEQVGSCG